MLIKILKIFTLLTVFIGVIGFIGWQNRVDILVAALPTVIKLFDLNPIEPNRDVEWKTTVTNNLTPFPDKPNIILILADDLGFNDISLTNGGAADGSVITPSIDSLGRNGITFNNGYAANAVCVLLRELQ